MSKGLRNGLTKRQWTALGRIFEREAGGLGVLESKSLTYTELAVEGCVERCTFDLGRDRFGPLVVTGWALTERGRFMYCEACQWFETGKKP